MRYRLDGSTTLSTIFSVMESGEDQVDIQEYGVCQTTLEQIFNNFAALQDEETGNVRGVMRESAHVAPEQGSLQAV